MPYPSALDVEAEEAAGVPPLVRPRGWAGAAGAAGACVRAAFVAAMRGVELDPAVGRWQDIPLDGGEALYRSRRQARTDAIFGRGVGMAAVVGRLTALRSLRLLLDGMSKGGAVGAVGGLAAGLTATGASLVALTIVVHRDVPVPAGLRAAAALPRLRHLVLAVPDCHNVMTANGEEPVAEAHDGAAEELIAVYTALAPRLRSLDLQVIGPALAFHDDPAAGVAWLGRLPVLPHVHFLGVDAPSTDALRPPPPACART